ncbi:hypothetical protein [Virgibacillus sp. L01]|uniref:hypothetical protein n=1 Tax=Virgibacillus sp. L01 TaxID=3457429 RepID=UPI003FCF481E
MPVQVLLVLSELIIGVILMDKIMEIDEEIMTLNEKVKASIDLDNRINLGKLI